MYLLEDLKMKSKKGLLSKYIDEDATKNRNIVKPVIPEALTRSLNRDTENIDWQIVNEDFNPKIPANFFKE